MMDYLEDILKVITNLGPEALTVAVMIALGYVLRILPAFPNKLIPYVCIFGAPFIYPFLTNPGRVAPDVQHPIVRCVITGFLLGAVAWFSHNKVLAHIENKIPGLKGLLNRPDSTPPSADAAPTEPPKP